MRNATLRQLRIFSEVARHLSFARAAEAMHLTPPAVTMQIRELEAHVGLPLFDRYGRHVSLTSTGQALLDYTRRVLATIKDAEDHLLKLKHVEVGSITIGMVSTAKYFLPKLLAEFRAEHPGVELRLVVGNREQLKRMLRDNEVDLAIMGRPPDELATQAEPFAAQPHTFVASPEHPLARQGRLRPEQLIGHTLMAREPGSGTRDIMEKYFAEQGLKPNVSMEMASNEIIKQAVIAGMGLSFLSKHTLGLELHYGLISVLDVEGTPVLRTWKTVFSLSKTLSPAAEALRRFIRVRGGAFIAEQFGDETSASSDG